MSDIRGWSRRSVVTGVLFVMIACSASAHKQHVHQYIVHEAYLLLMQQAGNKISELPDHIGGLDPYYAGDSAWQHPYVTTGAWREDEEDVVFHYDVYSLYGLQYPLVSITHFWQADNGNFTRTPIRLKIERPPLPPVSADLPPFENAFDRLTRFRDGGWVLWYPRTIICENKQNGHILVMYPPEIPIGQGIPISYSGLTSFYRTNTCTLRPDQLSEFVVVDLNDAKQIDPKSVSSIRVLDEVRDHVVWETLGRMCHLLGDMSVPAHAHGDEHGLNPDSYEDYMGGETAPFTAWDHSNIGSIIDPYSGHDPLHYLMYITQEQSDHFGSNGPYAGAGNDIIGGDFQSEERAYLESKQLFSLGQPTSDAGPWTVENLNTIRDATFPAVIKATAGLLYWFCVETGLMEPLPTSVVNQSSMPTELPLDQNFPNPFNPRTVVRYHLSMASVVKLTVFDDLGREVSVLVNGKRPAGTQEVTFDGSTLASGIYFYRLQAGNVVQTRKMIMVK